MRSINGSLDRRIFTRRTFHSPTPDRLSYHHITEGSSLRIYTHIYKGIEYLFCFFFFLTPTVLCHYYYPETLRAAGNSKSLKVIRSDLINEFYYLAVMRVPDYPPTRRLVRSETDNLPPPSRCIVALPYININIYIMCTREPKRFFLFYPSVNVVVFFFVGLFIYLF